MLACSLFLKCVTRHLATLSALLIWASFRVWLMTYCRLWPAHLREEIICFFSNIPIAAATLAALSCTTTILLVMDIPNFNTFSCMSAFKWHCDEVIGNLPPVFINKLAGDARVCLSGEWILFWPLSDTFTLSGVSSYFLFISVVRWALEGSVYPGQNVLIISRKPCLSTIEKGSHISSVMLRMLCEAPVAMWGVHSPTFFLWKKSKRHPKPDQWHILTSNLWTKEPLQPLLYIIFCISAV